MTTQPSVSDERSVVPAGGGGDDGRWFRLTAVAIGGSLAAYWLLLLVREHFMDNLAVAVVGGVAFAAGFLTIIHHVSRPQPPPALEGPVFRRYRALLAELADFDERKRRLLQGGLVPQLRELIEDKLPELLQRRDRFASYRARCDLPGVTGEVAELERRLAVEEDPDIARALGRNLGIARSTLANYAALEKTLKLYELQIASIERHLENLDSKLHILDLDDDIKAAAEAIIGRINGDIEDLESALTQMDALGEGREARRVDGE